METVTKLFKKIGKMKWFQKLFGKRCSCNDR